MGQTASQELNLVAKIVVCTIVSASDPLESYSPQHTLGLAVGEVPKVGRQTPPFRSLVWFRATEAMCRVKPCHSHRTSQLSLKFLDVSHFCLFFGVLVDFSWRKIEARQSFSRDDWRSQSQTAILDATDKSSHRDSSWTCQQGWQLTIDWSLHRPFWSCDTISISWCSKWPLLYSFPCSSPFSNLTSSPLFP